MPLTTEVATSVVGKLTRPAVREAAEQKTERTVAKAFGQDTRSGGMVNHAVFFDTNFDRKVSLAETTQGLKDIQLSKHFNGVLALVANLVLGDGLRAEAGSSFWYRLKNLFTVNLDHLEAQASKEGVGKLDPARRVASQMKFDTGNTGAVTLEEIGRWIDAEHPGGKNGRTKAGFGQLFQIGADTTKTVTVKGVEQQVPAMSREALEHFYQGRLFYDIAERNGHPHPLPPQG